MDCLKAIHERHSYRGAFQPHPVPRADQEKILAAAAAAPSGCNKEWTEFVMVDDPATLAKIAGHIDMPAVRTATAMLLVVGDPRPAYGDMSFELADTASCVMTAWLAMTALGYATVWLDGVLRGGLDATLGAVVGVPEGKTVRVLLPFGTPAGKGTPPSKRPASERVHFNRW